MSTPTESGTRPIRTTHEAHPVHLLDATSVPGERTRVHGVLWDGVLNATPEDTLDGPLPIEALLAALAGCAIRNLRSVTDAAHVRFERVQLRVAAERSDDPPAITRIRLDIAVDTEVAVEQARRLVELALRNGTITRTVARGTSLDVHLALNGTPTEVTYAD